jgi:hypothetical protein
LLGVQDLKRGATTAFLEINKSREGRRSKVSTKRDEGIPLYNYSWKKNRALRLGSVNQSIIIFCSGWWGKETRVKQAIG